MKKNLLIYSLLITFSLTNMVFAQPQLTLDEQRRVVFLEQIYLQMANLYYKEVAIDRDTLNYIVNSQVHNMRLLSQENTEIFQTKSDQILHWNAAWLVKLLRDPKDNQSAFIPKSLLPQHKRKQTKSQFDGVGIDIERKGEDFFISNVYENSPAFEEGLRAGTRLLSLNGNLLKEWDIEDVAQKLEAVSQNGLMIGFEDRKKVKEVFLTRRTITIPSVEAFFYPNQQIGMIAIESFRESTADEFREAFSFLEQKSLKGLIIDLRHNGGGNIEMVPKILNLFLEDGSLIAYFKKRKLGTQRYKTRGKPEDISYPIVILVNKKTASAAEVFAGAMRYYGKAVIVGAQTTGIGVLKNEFTFKEGSSLRLVTSYTYLPDGKTFHEIGLFPDIVIRGREEQLNKAFEIILNNRV